MPLPRLAFVVSVFTAALLGACALLPGSDRDNGKKGDDEAGASARKSIGITVFSGMLGVTFFGIFLTPVFYSLLRKGTEKRRARAAAPRPNRCARCWPPRATSRRPST